MKNIKLPKALFYILSFTWGICITFLGLVLTLVLIPTHSPKKNVYGWYFEIGRNWGGFNLGLVSIVPTNPSEYIKLHEFGHSIQNCIYGPFTLFIVTVPSVIRYWYREFLVKVKGRNINLLPDYYSIWFEKQASNLGNIYRKEQI